MASTVSQVESLAFVPASQAENVYIALFIMLSGHMK